jgi:chlorite dismutase
MQNHNYIFLKSNPSLNTLPNATLQKYKKEFLKELTGSKDVIIHTYATLGLKVNTNILIWFQAETIDSIQDLLNKLMHTDLGKHLTITYGLFGMTRPTQYSPNSTKHVDTSRKGKEYLIIYPFTKTKEWYSLDFDTRRKLMGGHVMVGKKYPQIEQILLYSYGIDDNEFIVSYEMDKLSDFQSLVMELRTDKVRAYTQNDTPIFTCIYKSPEKALDYL